MKNKLDIWKCLLPALMLSVASCVTEDIDSCPEEPEQSGNRITLQFIVSEESPVTRANPVGGEDGNMDVNGNVREDEIFNEATLHDVNLFFFANDKKDTEDIYLLNAAGNTKLVHLYFNLDDPGDRENSLSFTKKTSEEGNRTVYTITFLDEVPGIVLPLRSQGTVRFITVANRGRSMNDELATEDASGNKKDIQLQDLWNYSGLSATWTGTGQDVSDGYDRFVMTTAYENAATDSFITFSNVPGAGTETSPFLGKTTLQRMCARIDVMYAADNLKAENDKSELKYTVTGTSGNTVHITNMLPVNVMSSPSYLFKLVTNGEKTDWSQIGGHQWGGREATYTNGEPSNYVLEPNTLLKETLSGDNLTGKQNSWYGDTRASNIINAIENGGTVGGYHHGALKTTDKGFEAYSRIAVLGYANENTQSPNQFNSNYLTGIAFRAVYVPAVIQPSQTTDKPTKIYRYSPSKDGEVDESKSLYFSDKASCDAYQDAHKTEMADITGFDAVEYGDKWGFVCYYNLWLKHYDDVDDDPDTHKSNPHKAYPMQYATVRNNIYRVGLKFNGPGDPSLTMREPETMQARIFVRKWNLRKEEEPLQF